MLKIFWCCLLRQSLIQQAVIHLFVHEIYLNACYKWSLILDGMKEQYVQQNRCNDRSETSGTETGRKESKNSWHVRKWQVWWRQSRMKMAEGMRKCRLGNQWPFSYCFSGENASLKNLLDSNDNSSPGGGHSKSKGSKSTVWILKPKEIE